MIRRSLWKIVIRDTGQWIGGILIGVIEHIATLMQRMKKPPR
jgi:hypothetical protein